MLFKLKLLLPDIAGQPRHNLQIKKCQQLPHSNTGDINKQNDFSKNTQENMREYMISGLQIYLNNGLHSSQSSINATS